MSELSEFAENLGARLASAWAELNRSIEAGDDYGVLVHSADIANLERLAEGHDVRLGDDPRCDGVLGKGVPCDGAPGGSAVPGHGASAAGLIQGS